MRMFPFPKRLLLAVLAATLCACDIVEPDSAALPSAIPATPELAATAAPAADLPAPNMLARGLRERTLGEYDAAASDFYALLSTYPEAAEARQARYYLAESFALRERWSSAADALRAFLDEGSQDELSNRAMFWLARSHEEAGSWAEAARVYETYRELNTVLAPYARLREAAQQQALGETAQAAESYAAVAAADIARGEKAGSHEKAIALYRQLGQNNRALELYQQLLGIAESSTYRTRILAEAAALAREQNAGESARTWETELIQQYPASGEALTALRSLQGDSAATVAPERAALVYESHDMAAEAIPLLDAAIAAGGDTLEFQRRRALMLRSQGDTDGALAALASISAADPNGPVGRQAQLDWVQTRGQAGDTEGAITGYQEFANAYPDDPLAPEALDRAAQLYDRISNSEAAAAQRQELGQRYPASSLGQNGLDSAGWYFYGQSRPAEAAAVWQQLASATSGAVQARAAFWAARATAESGGDGSALYQQALQAAPDAYYGVRAAEVLGQLQEAATPFADMTTGPMWQEAETWIAGWSGASAPDIDRQGYPAELTSSGPVARALALAEVGLLDDAVAEWNEARSRWAESPQQLYMVARLASENNVPYIGLKAAEDLVALAPADASPAPLAIQRLIFPTPYAESVATQAEEFGIDARALYALLRQESLFHPHATSWVGARGLAQVMPETAQGIAANLQMAEFTSDDLYKPWVSIRFGAFYLSRQQSAMNGSLQGALAAYNGGPGNAVRWAGGDTVADPDGFVETIDYPETEGYVKLVYGYYDVYRRLYAAP